MINHFFTNTLTRPDTTQPWLGTDPAFVAFINALSAKLEELGGDESTVFSPDDLTKKRVYRVPDENLAAFNTFRSQYQSLLDAESARRTAAGMIMTTTSVTQ